jgi:hypothetical protein
LWTTAVNILPFLAFGWPMVAAARAGRARAPAWASAAILVVVGIAYSLLVYWSVVSLFAIIRGDTGAGLVVRLFPSGAGAWQLLQGFVVFLLVWALARMPVAAPAPDRPTVEPLRRIHLRHDDEIASLDVVDIVAISSCDDYSEVVTTRRRHLSRRSLSAFEDLLAGARFVRVHRAHLVNLDRLDRAEPAGDGTLILHLADGSTIRASRSGSRRLRQLSV